MKSLKTLLLPLFLAYASCVKQAYEAPPDLSKSDPGLPVNLTIAELKARFASASTAQRIDSAWRIAGIVVADDRSGNFYKQITIQDSTAGITILIDRHALYSRYPVGRKLYIDLQGLYLGLYNSYPQLGFTDASGAMSEIPPTVVDSFITGADYPHEIIPDTVALDVVKVVSPAYVNRLIVIKDVQFQASELGLTYALDPNTASQSGTDRYIESCTGSGKLSVRTSNYASFRNAVVPAGKGTIAGIYTVFHNTPQLVIRDTTDLSFYNPRCDSSTPGTIILNETFDGETTGDISLPGWTNYPEAGSEKWQYSNAGSTSNPYARISAYNTGQSSIISWLITPPLDLSGVANAVLSFRSLSAFHNGAKLEVMYSTDFTGDPASASWTPLPAIISQNTGSFSGASWVNSGEIQLPAATKLNIAFKYTGSDPDQTTTYEIDDVTVSGQ